MKISEKKDLIIKMASDINAKQVIERLKRVGNFERAKLSLRYIKTGKGQYGEGDKFIGVRNPEVRKIAKEFSEIILSEIKKLLTSPFHEARLTALFILVMRFENGSEAERKNIFYLYLHNTKFINNWDLVDTSAHKIVGAYLYDKNKNILQRLVRSKSLWERRIAIISTLYFIKNKKYSDAFRLAKILMRDKEDLIQKAVGWMLREVGKNCSVEAEETFLHKYYKLMPRTTLRYAVERFPERLRLAYLNNRII